MEQKTAWHDIQTAHTASKAIGDINYGVLLWRQATATSAQADQRPTTLSGSSLTVNTCTIKFLIVVETIYEY